MRTIEQQKSSLNNLGKAWAKGPWNKGKSYTFKKREVYANKGAWRMALLRHYEDKCMVCGWNKAACDCHHINPKGNGGKHTLENGIILCPNCHRLANLKILSPNQLTQAKSNVIIKNNRV